MNARDSIHERIHGPGYCDPPCGLCREVTGLVDDLLDEHADELKERLRERLPMGYKHWADVYLDSSEEGEVECSHEGLECQWSRCQEKKPPEVSE